MPRDYPDDVGKQNFLAEVYDKERTAQLGWYFKKTLPQSEKQNPDQKSRQYEVFSRRIEAACPQPTPALISLRQRRNITDSNEVHNTALASEQIGTSSAAATQTQGVSDSTSSVVALPPISSTSSPVSITSPSTQLLSAERVAAREMFQPDSTIRRQIYEGGPGARVAYLKTRQRRRPESRYAFPVVSSWEYGWRLGDVIATDDMRNPPHGRCRIVADTFYRRNGLPQAGGT